MERCRLFLLIALGETVVTPGVALPSAPIRVVASLAVVVVLAGLVTVEHLKPADPPGPGAATDST